MSVMGEAARRHHTESSTANQQADYVGVHLPPDELHELCVAARRHSRMAVVRAGEQEMFKVKRRFRIALSHCRLARRKGPFRIDVVVANTDFRPIRAREGTVLPCGSRLADATDRGKFRSSHWGRHR